MNRSIENVGPMLGTAECRTAIEYEYRFTEYRFTEYDQDEVRSDARTNL